MKSFKGWKPYVAALVCLLAILLFDNLYGTFLDLTGAKVEVNINQENLDTIEQSFPILSLIIFFISLIFLKSSIWDIKNTIVWFLSSISLSIEIEA